MDLNILFVVDSIIKKYTKGFMLGNRLPDLALTLNANINEEDKEFILNELDIGLPLGTNFEHTYENGKLEVVFKEVDYEKF